MYLPSKSLLFREYPRGFHTSCEAFIKSAFLAIFSGFQINHANPALPANVLFGILVLKILESEKSENFSTVLKEQFCKSKLLPNWVINGRFISWNGLKSKLAILEGLKFDFMYFPYLYRSPEKCTATKTCCSSVMNMTCGRLFANPTFFRVGN